MPTVTSENKAEFDQDFMSKKSNKLSFDQFMQMADKGKIKQAKSGKAELEDLLSGKSEFAELPGHTSESDIYDLMDKGYQSSYIHGPNHWVVGKPEAVNKAELAFELKNWYGFGKLYGYSDEDIAHFYRHRHREMQGGQSKQADMRAFADYADDMRQHREMEE